MEKTLHNSDVSGAHQNVPDIKVVGNGEEKEGWDLISRAPLTGDFTKEDVADWPQDHAKQHKKTDEAIAAINRQVEALLEAAWAKLEPEPEADPPRVTWKLQTEGKYFVNCDGGISRTNHLPYCGRLTIEEVCERLNELEKEG